MAKPFEKLKKEDEFKQVRQAGRFCTSKTVRVSVLKKEEGGIRVGIVVSKKVSKLAVVRNKIRRRVNAILVADFAGDMISADIVVTALSGAQDATFDQLREEVKACINKLFVR